MEGETGLRELWRHCQANEGEEAARAVHALRGRMLTVHASQLAEQLGLMETACRDGEKESVSRLVSVISPMIEEVAEAATKKAMA